MQPLSETAKNKCSPASKECSRGRTDLVLDACSVQGLFLWDFKWLATNFVNITPNMVQTILRRERNLRLIIRQRGFSRKG